MARGTEDERARLERDRAAECARPSSAGARSSGDVLAAEADHVPPSLGVGVGKSRTRPSASTERPRQGSPSAKIRSCGWKVATLQTDAICSRSRRRRTKSSGQERRTSTSRVTSIGGLVTELSGTEFRSTERSRSRATSAKPLDPGQAWRRVTSTGVPPRVAVDSSSVSPAGRAVTSVTRNHAICRDYTPAVDKSPGCAGPRRSGSGNRAAGGISAVTSDVAVLPAGSGKRPLRQPNPTRARTTEEHDLNHSVRLMNPITSTPSPKGPCAVLSARRERYGGCTGPARVPVPRVWSREG